MGDEALTAETVLSGTLHVYVAFDWGEEVDLDHARRIVPAEVQGLARRPRTLPRVVRPARGASAPRPCGHRGNQRIDVI